MPPAPKYLSGLFLLGTDTSVGKTTVGAALLHALVAAGQRPVPHKPVETGATPVPTDAEFLRFAARREDLPLHIVCPRSFPAPLAPAAAATLTGTVLDPIELVRSAKTAAKHGNFLLVESAGGLLTPYTARFTAADLAKALRLPVLLIARNALGTVNHTALAVSEIHRRGLSLFGIVLVNTTPTSSPDQAFNSSLITNLTGISPLGIYPFVPAAKLPDLAAALYANLHLPPRLASLLNEPLPRPASER
jgi:dethiobiotin synthetase